MDIHKKYDLGEVVRRLVRARLSPPGQPAVFRFFEGDLPLSVLESAVDFHPSVARVDRAGLVYKAASAAVGEPGVDAEVLKTKLREVEREYLRTPISDYVLATSLGFRPFRALRRARVHGSQFEFTGVLPRRFDRGAVVDDVARYTKGAPAGVTQVRIRVRARTVTAAYEEALWRLDLLRGLWNFLLNFRTSMRHLSGEPRPVNAILPGPIYTVHRADGSMPQPNLWYNLQQLDVFWVHPLERDWPELRTWTITARRTLRRIPYRSELEALFVRYARALDPVEYDVAFGRLWSVLEHLTDSVAGYTQLITRTTFLYHPTERQFAKVILEHLRDVRNELVHMAANRDGMERYLYQLKSFVETVMQFHLGQGRRFGSRAAVGAFLDLPVDPSYLQREIKRYRHALRVVTP
jgi:hypothetical protein